MSEQYNVPQDRFGAVFSEVLPHDFNPAVSDREARELLKERLEVEGRVKYDEVILSELKEDHPMYADALRDWLKSEKQKLIDSGAEITDEMIAEAEILDGIIAEVSEEGEDESLIKLAVVMRDIRVARRALREFQARHTRAA